MKARKGFTLMELLVVVLVLATLAGIMVPRIVDYQKNAKIANCKSNIVNLKKALEQYAVEFEGVYPGGPGEWASLLANTKYFPHGKPTCGYDGTAYSYDATNKTVVETDHAHGSVAKP